ncbi:MAG: DegV family EDD domain-containing protein [Eubacterium sp.]|nr:DegV family EDD domain-containing protein [Eubacterium sp.]
MKIFTDMALDADVSFIMKHEISVIPATIVSAGEEKKYSLEDIDKESLKEFFVSMKKGSLPQTRALDKEAFASNFEPVLSKGEDVLYISVASELTSSSAAFDETVKELKVKFPDRKVERFDSCSASVGMTALIHGLKEETSESAGITVDEALAKLTELRKNLSGYFIIEDMFHMRRGGKYKGADIVTANAMKIRPIMSINDEGIIENVSKQRGTGMAMAYMADKVAGELSGKSGITVFISHVNSEEKAEKFKDLLIERGVTAEYSISSMGPVTGTHVGPGGIAVAYL